MNRRFRGGAAVGELGLGSRSADHVENIERKFSTDEPIISQSRERYKFWTGYD